MALKLPVWHASDRARGRPGVGTVRGERGRSDHARANVYPRNVRPEQKIDAADALIMGIARCIAAAGLGLRDPRLEFVG